MVKKSQALAEVGAVAGILESGRNGNWQALAWFLERKFNDRWGRREFIKQEITDGTITVVVEHDYGDDESGGES